MLLFHHVSVKSDFFKLFKHVLVFFTYLVSFYGNFVTFSSKNWQSYKEKLLFSDIEIFTIVSDVFEHVLKQFSKHMEAILIALKQVCWQRQKQSLAVFSKKRYSQNSGKTLQKSNIKYQFVKMQWQIYHFCTI